MSNKTPFTECLGKFRSDCHLTQRALAQAMGITEGNISKVERGVVAPTIGFLNKMFDALQLEKRGHWYDQFVEALVISRGKLTFEFSKLEAHQIAVLSELNNSVAGLDDAQCGAIINLIQNYKKQVAK